MNNDNSLPERHIDDDDQRHQQHPRPDRRNRCTRSGPGNQGSGTRRIRGRALGDCQRAEQRDTLPVFKDTTKHNRNSTTWSELIDMVNMWRNRYPGQTLYVLTGA